MKSENEIKSNILRYAKEKFNTDPEYLWIKSPNSAILRHCDNSKWYALITNISKKKLGMTEEEFTDILNVKCDPLLICSLLNDKGFFPAYHMNKKNWITILLDGSVSEDKIFKLLASSFELTNKK